MREYVNIAPTYWLDLKTSKRVITFYHFLALLLSIFYLTFNYNITIILLSNRTSNFGLQMKNCHLATINLFMVKKFYLTITIFLEDGNG